MIHMHIEAANVAPDFMKRRKITAAELRHVQDPCVVFEHYWLDDSGAKCWAYTVGGWLGSEPLGGMQGGVTIGGQIIIVHADTRAEADMMAGLGLQDTIAALDGEETAYIEAQAAMARLEEVSPLRRMDLATAPAADKSDEFVEDMRAVTALHGDGTAIN